MEPIRLPIAHSARMRAARLALAGGAVLTWIGLILADQFLSAMFFSEPSATLPVVTSPLLLAAVWIARMATVRGVIEVHHDRLVIHHARVLRRPLEVARAQVERVLLDDGAATGRARFPTGDAAEPLLWTDPVPRRQHHDRPLLGDGLLPNLAIVLAQPLRLAHARDWLTAVPFGHEINPPSRDGVARALLLTVEDLDAARSALAGWRVEQATAAQVVPPQVAAAAAQVPRDAAGILLLTASIAIFTFEHRLIGFLIWFPLAFALLMRMQRRRQAQAAEAREEVDRRASSMTPAERAVALAAIDANLGSPPSQGPPGFDQRR